MKYDKISDEDAKRYKKDSDRELDESNACDEDDDEDEFDEVEGNEAATAAG
jgi:hypothetical protein